MPPTLLMRSAAIIAMAIGTVVVVTELDAWIGDLGALLWVCACFFLPFVTGIGLGSGALGNAGKAGGALMGGILALAPAIAMSSIEGVQGVAGNASLALLIVFPLLGMAQGAIAMPVGGSVRKRQRGA